MSAIEEGVNDRSCLSYGESRIVERVEKAYDKAWLYHCLDSPHLNERDLNANYNIDG